MRAKLCAPRIGQSKQNMHRQRHSGMKPFFLISHLNSVHRSNNCCNYEYNDIYIIYTYIFTYIVQTQFLNYIKFLKVSFIHLNGVKCFSFVDKFSKIHALNT